MRLVEELVHWNNGTVISVDGVNLLFDPLSGAHVTDRSHVFISHAHADHTYGLTTRGVKHATIETRRIYEALNGERVRNCSEARIGVKTNIGNAAVEPLNAGHILGSVQYRISTPDSEIIYTGDINCTNTLTTEAATQTECDRLIIEATYGSPQYIFPRRERTYAEMVRWAIEEVRSRRIPVFQVYSAGKAQEVVRLFNTYTRLPVFCHPSICKVNDIHRQFEGEIQYYDLSQLDEIRPEACVCLTTPSSPLPAGKRFVRAAATGWSLIRQRSNGASFPLSSHADFHQLTNYVRLTGAKNVYLFTGYTEIFADHLRRRLEVNAMPIMEVNQLTMEDFRSG